MRRQGNAQNTKKTLCSKVVKHHSPAVMLDRAGSHAELLPASGQHVGDGIGGQHCREQDSPCSASELLHPSDAINPSIYAKVRKPAARHSHLAKCTTASSPGIANTPNIGPAAVVMFRNKKKITDIEKTTRLLLKANHSRLLSRVSHDKNRVVSLESRSVESK